MTSVSVLTATIPGREWLLRQCRASVASQTVPVEHIVVEDPERRGLAAAMNAAASLAETEWLFVFADDDLMLPACVELHLARSVGADVVYAPPLVWGNNDTHFWGEPPEIPSHALVRTELWRELEGYDETRRREEDRDLWTRAMEKGATFVRVADGPTWVYVFHGGNKSYCNGHAS